MVTIRVSVNDRPSPDNQGVSERQTLTWQSGCQWTTDPHLTIRVSVNDRPSPDNQGVSERQTLTWQSGCQWTTDPHLTIRVSVNDRPSPECRQGLEAQGFVSISHLGPLNRPRHRHVYESWPTGRHEPPLRHGLLLHTPGGGTNDL